MVTHPNTHSMLLNSGIRIFTKCYLLFLGGFIVALGSGRTVMVEADLKQEEEVKLKVNQIIKLPQRNATTAGTWMSAETASGNKVIAMALNNTESMLIALTDTLQLMSFHLKEKSKSNKGEFQVFSHPFHNGAIIGKNSCARQGLNNRNYQSRPSFKYTIHSFKMAE